MTGSHEDSQKDLWHASTSGSNVALDPDSLLRSLHTRGRRADRHLRWAELTDLWSGIALAGVLTFLFVRDPELLTGAPIAAIIGGTLIALAYVAYHVAGVRARARTEPSDPTLIEFLRAEQRHVDRRIALLDGVWAHMLVAVIGFAMLIHGCFDGLAVGLALDAAVLGVALAGLWYARRTSRRVYEPLRASIGEQLHSLQRN